MIHSAPLSDKSILPRRPSLVRILTALTGYAIYAGASVVFFTVMPLLLIFAPRPRLLQRMIDLVYRGFLHFLTRVSLPSLGIYRIVEESGFGSLPDSPVVFVANHRSRIDGPMLLGMLPATGVVMKASYAKLPVFSSFVKYIDFISVDPRSLDSLATALTRCEDLVRRGHRILIFPEGARASSARIQPFKDLAFRISSEMGIPVVPVVVHTDHPFMAKIKGSYIPPFTMRFTIRALDSLTAEKNERASEFASRVRRLIAEELKLLDKGTIWENL